ncbi:MAG: O-antigen ligase family protein [Oscillospiraceae bacterium]|nr:O-antigen ligase family protein [Oscillospiraceae bacterium]
MEYVIHIRKKPKRITIFYIASYLLLNFLCVSQLYSFRAISGALSLMLICGGLFLPYSELFIYLFTCLPFFNVLNLQIGTTSFYYFLMGIVMIRYLTQGYNSRTPTRIVFFLLIILITCSNIDGKNEYIQWLIRLLPFVFLLDDSVLLRCTGKCIERFALSMVLASVWGFVMYKTNSYLYGTGYVYSGNSISIRFAGLTGDSVWYSIQLVMIISMLLVLLFLQKREMAKGWIIAEVVALCYFGLLTYSKTLLVSLAIMLFFCYFYWVFHHEKSRTFWLKNIMAILLIVSVVLVFSALVLNSSLPWFVSIRTRLFAADISTGRVDVWKYYIDWIFSHWTSIFHGMGFAEYSRGQYIPALGRVVGYSHNMYLDTIVLFGVIEAIAVFVWLGVYVGRALRNSRNMICFLPVLMLLVCGITTHVHFEFSFYLTALLSLCALKMPHNSKLNLTGTSQQIIPE